VLFLGLSWAALRLLRALRGPSDEVVFETLCPVCRRGIRFGQKQIGKKGACPYCESYCVFPDPMSDAQPVDSKRAVKKWTKAMKDLPRRKKGPP
jgi:hypothetical protein